MSEIVERLRSQVINECGDEPIPEWCVRTGKCTCKQKLNDAAYIESLESALRQIYECGPMTVDDQRWRIARDALGLKTKAPDPA